MKGFLFHKRPSQSLYLNTLAQTSDTDLIKATVFQAVEASNLVLLFLDLSGTFDAIVYMQQKRHECCFCIDFNLFIFFLLFFLNIVFLVRKVLAQFSTSIFSNLCLIPTSLKVSQQAAKCIPAMVCPELTEQIRREVAASLHQRKGDFTCYFLTDLVTFTLPAG